MDTNTVNEKTENGLTLTLDKHETDLLSKNVQPSTSTL